MQIYNDVTKKSHKQGFINFKFKMALYSACGWCMPGLKSRKTRNSIQNQA